MILWKEPLQLTHIVRHLLKVLKWKPLSELIREPITSAGQGTFTFVGNFKNLWLRQPCQCMNMKAMFAEMNTTRSSEDNARKNSGLCGI